MNLDGCARLFEVHCGWNGFDTDQLAALVAGLPDRSAVSSGRFYPGSYADSVDKNAVEAKGWHVFEEND